MVKRHFYWVAFLLLVSCKSRLDHDTTFEWHRDDESIQLTLKTDGRFTLEKAGYNSRFDSGSYRVIGDTLIINPDKKPILLDSIMSMDSTYYGNRYMEVMEEIISSDSSSILVSEYRALIFPMVTINESIDLTIHPEDPSFKKLIIPDSLIVKQVEVKLHQDNTCKPTLHLFSKVQPVNSMEKSYRVYLRSVDRVENYLAGYRWIIKGDKVYLYFTNEDCDPNEVVLTTSE